MDYKDHKFRSYYGFICWIMIQTKHNDLFIIDGIKLRSHLIELIKVTLNPKILKLLPSSADLSSFQRDFGIYLVNVLTMN